MARKNSTDMVETPESTEAVAPVETPEAVTETPAEAPIDLTEFQSVVGVSVATRDESTGVVTEENLKPVTDSYRTLDGIKPKNAAKNWVQSQMLDAVSALDGQLARAFSLVNENLTAGPSGTKAERKPADPVAAFVQQVASLQLALQVVNSEAPEVEGDRDINAEVDKLVSESTELLDKYLAYGKDESEDKGDAPELTPVLKAAIKAASGKATGAKRAAFTGKTGDVAKHIVEAFEGHPEGHVLKVSEIAKFKSTEYPEGSASQGAITVRLFPTNGKPSTVPGVTPIERDDNGPRRAAKA